MLKVGLIALSAKPLHVGHHELIMLASQECDVVHAYVSTSDRIRKGEVPVYGHDMITIWTDMIEPILPDNVKVEYGGSPVGKIWSELGEENLVPVDKSFIIYSDPHDITANFPERSLIKYAGNLYKAGLVTLRAVSRSETTDISGTEMRQFLSDDNRLAFIHNLPKGLDGNAIWNRLYASSKR